METNVVLYSIESCSFARVARSVLPNKISSRLLQVLFLFFLLSSLFPALPLSLSSTSFFSVYCCFWGSWVYPVKTLALVLNTLRNNSGNIFKKLDFLFGFFFFLVCWRAGIGLGVHLPGNKLLLNQSFQLWRTASSHPGVYLGFLLATFRLFLAHCTNFVVYPLRWLIFPWPGMLYNGRRGT